jgi:hypothetical protein
MFLYYCLLLVEGKDDWRVRTNKLLENNSISRPPMPKHNLLLGEITELVLGGYINNVLQCLRLIDRLHHRADINKYFSCILVLALGWIKVDAESIDEGEVKQVGYTPLVHKHHDISRHDLTSEPESKLLVSTCG